MFSQVAPWLMNRAIMINPWKDDAGDCGRSAAAEVGWREAVAVARARAAVGGAPASPARRTVLRRAGSCHRSAAEARAPQRHQSARHQLLCVVEARTPDPVRDEKRSRAVLPVSRSVQRAVDDRGRQYG